ncbi:hypothetical protein ES708_33528 [subsurface metagenome]
MIFTPLKAVAVCVGFGRLWVSVKTVINSLRLWIVAVNGVGNVKRRLIDEGSAVGFRRLLRLKKWVTWWLLLKGIKGLGKKRILDRLARW